MTNQEMLAEAVEHARAGRLGEAEELYRRVLAVAPTDALANFNLANLLRRQGRAEEAIDACRRAVDARPDFAEALNNLGALLLYRGDFSAAADALRSAVRAKPTYTEAHSRLGEALICLGRHDDAADELTRALATAPSHAGVLRALALARMFQGDVAEAIRCFSIPAMADARVASERLCALWMSDEFNARSILREHRQWNERFARTFAVHGTPHSNDPSPDRPLRIGYFSPDFTRSTLGCSVLALLRHHDASSFKVTCYSAASRPDDMTRELAREADEWRDVAASTDEEFAEIVRSDGIDILIDLALHSAQNRLLALARKPAPVQVAYLAYPGTTGVDGIGYRISDPYIDGADADLSCYSEQTVRLPRAYWAYTPMGPLPDVGPLPARAAGHVTFGCLNQPAKMSPRAVELWATVLTTVPSSHLLVHSLSSSHRARLVNQFAGAAVDPRRIRFVPRLPWDQYVRTYNRIDLCLDTTPFAGGIATCDALMMGVPMVTVRAQTAVGRGGSSILANLGLPELIAGSADEFVRIAAELAADTKRLSEVRAALRGRMEASALRDHAGFVRDLEGIYRSLWHSWCAGRVR